MTFFRIWTWAAIGLLALGSVSVFALFLRTSWKAWKGESGGRTEL